MSSSKLEKQAETLFQYHRDISGFYNEYAKSVGLTLASLDVLVTLLKEKNCTQKTISNLTYLPKQTVSAIIKGFTDKGIIGEPTEVENDKRNKVINFTEDGKKFAEKIVEKAKSIELNALDKLGEEKRELLLSIIKDYKENLKNS